MSHSDLLTGKFGSFKPEVTADIRSFTVEEVNGAIGSHPAGQRNKLAARLAWLTTDPEIGEAVKTSLAGCPYKATGSGKVKELTEKNAALQKEIDALKNK